MVNVQLIINRADYPWCLEDYLCFELQNGLIELHPEWKEFIGESGHFLVNSGAFFKNDLFRGTLYTVGDDNTAVATDGEILGMLRKSDHKVSM